MSGVSGPISRKPAARREQGLPLLLHCAEQLHVHVPPGSCAIEIESTPSAVGTLVGAAVGPAKHTDRTAHSHWLRT
jgi:hypothetical protein